jgi:putative ABC transport system permease protein
MSARTMRPLQLVFRSLRHYWRTNLAVIAGVGVAVAVLAGALLVGDSVRASLRELAVGRLGRTDHLVASTQFFRHALVQDLARQPQFASCCAAMYGLIAVDGLAARPDSSGTSGRRASGVAVYGIDERFWTFHGRPSPGALRPREAYLSPGLARELWPDEGQSATAAEPGGEGRSVLVRVQQPSAVPLGSLHGRRDEAGKTIRAMVRGVLPAEAMGEFSLRPRQGDVRAIFLPLARLQADLNQPDRINAILVAARAPDAERGSHAAREIEAMLAPSLAIEDAGLNLRGLPDDRGFILESDAGLLSDAVADVAERIATAQGLQATPVFSYLAYSIRSGTHEIPYSIVAGMDLGREGVKLPSPHSGAPNARSGRVGVEPGAPNARSGRVGVEPSPRRGEGVDLAQSSPTSPIWLNAWAAEALHAKPGAPVTIDYDVWEDAGGLTRRQAAFTTVGVLPMEGAGADPTLTPEYPGITGQESLSDWDPPFPLDLARITPRDEEYWDRYRAAPKAIITLGDAQRLWGSRFGRLTSIRLAASGSQPARLMPAYREALQAALTPTTAGLMVQPVRATALAGASGTTDFGQYFLYFSFFLVVSGLLLAGLFFRLGVEQRLREVGLLQALGYTPALVRRLFLAEGLVLAVAGSVVGLVGALAYAAAIMFGLRTWWVGAVGTTALTLKPSATSLLIGAVAGVITAVLAIAWTLRGITRIPSRMLLHEDLSESHNASTDASPASQADSGPSGATAASRSPQARVSMATARRRLLFITFAGLALALTLASAFQAIDRTGGFFGAGGAALIAALSGLSLWLHRAPSAPVPSPTPRALWHFGQVNAAARPGRTILSVALIAFATFVIVTVGAFRQEGVAAPEDPRSGTGGYALIAESVAPIADDPNTPAGRRSLGLDSPELQPILSGTSIARFRLRPGDDGSCLNLYRPENPRVIAPEDGFVTDGGRFTFASSLAETEAERGNPWLLLNRTFSDGAVPTIVDFTSLMYVFHRSLGDDIVLSRASGTPVKLRVVGALSHSVFQSELIVSEPSFVRLFPGNEGYRLFLIQVAGGAADRSRADRVGRTLENRLADFGVEAMGTTDRLRAYQQVENTYLSTFQALGALGLVLGTLGVGTVLLRNILERRRELALLQAIGYREGHVRGLILAESLSLVVWGLAAGTACALLAVLPAIVEHGGRFPWTVMIGLLTAVLVAGLLSSVVATAMAVRLPLLASLRAE